MKIDKIGKVIITEDDISIEGFTAIVEKSDMVGDIPPLSILKKEAIKWAIKMIKEDYEGGKSKSN